MTQRLLVTGAGGSIGCELVRALLAGGADVLAVDDFRKGGHVELEAHGAQHARRLEIVAVDLARALPATLQRERFGLVAHLAAVVGVDAVVAEPWRTIETNLRSTLNVLELAIERLDGTFLFASSSEGYASSVTHGLAPIPTPEDVPLSIDDPREPRWSYAASKIAGESAVHAAARVGHFRPLVVRFHNVYGPRMGDTHVVPRFFAACRARLDPVVVHGPEQTRSFLFVDDAVRALECILHAAPAEGGTYHVGWDEETRIDDLARLCLAVSGHVAALEARPAPAASVARRVPDVRRLRALGFEPRVGLCAGLTRCWEALRSG